jgi:hypothetical protein
MAVQYRTPGAPPHQDPADRTATRAAAALRELADTLDAHDFGRAKALLPRLRAACWSVVPIASRRGVGR